MKEVMRESEDPLLCNLAVLALVSLRKKLEESFHAMRSIETED